MSGVTTLFISVIVVSIILALFLAYIANLQAQARLKRKPRYTTYNSDESSPSSLEKTIFDEIGKFASSPREREELSKAVSNILNQEIERKVATTTDHLEKRYKEILEKKSKEEEIVIQKYKKTLEEKRNTEAVIRSIAEGLVVVDDKGKVIMMNPAAEKLLGAPKKEKVGKNLTENLKEEQIISMIKETPKGKDIEVIGQDEETKKILRASSAVIEDENGKTIGMVSVLSDITKQKELERLKSNFIASVSHELRTPLVAIQKSIALLLSNATGPLSDTQEQFLTIADRNIKRLSNLINDLLDLSKLEAGKMRLEPKLSSISQLIEETVETFQTWADSKSITITKKIESGLPSIEIDPTRIIQVITNLVGNAIKFTPPEGKITIEAHLNSSENVIEVSVADTGPGIAEKELRTIFDKFYQTAERSYTDISGTGLGLSIAKEIVELHGGKIWAESKKGQGAKFIFTLPIKTS